MPTSSPESNNHLKPGEINFDLIPKDWALTPLQGKRAYIAGWTTQPYSVEEIKREFNQGKATGSWINYRSMVKQRWISLGRY